MKQQELLILMLIHLYLKLELKESKLYVPVVTLPIQDDNKLLEQLKAGFKRTIRWNKFRSEMSNQAKNSNTKLFN